ncbi:unnamed protein product [Microthlaspi erraticum]|uniref:FKB95-like N-terminal Kelch domain-containing protein n=1 Tax=Microthlaspi erraticum TaxID=1685480 RepID=A0A6D2I4F8_9BRAS|nr:unnamed protein product [Microthlaspi erraticum]
MEVFDPKTQTWELVVCPVAERCRSRVSKSAVIEGRILYMFLDGGVAYKPREDSWEAIQGPSRLEIGWPQRSYCVVDNVLCCFRNPDGVKWYDSEGQDWMNMKGLRGLPRFDVYSVLGVADYGGKLAVLWASGLRANGYGYKEKTIWCAVIVLEKRNGGEEIWGVVECIDPVLTVPAAYDMVRALAATV